MAFPSAAGGLKSHAERGLRPSSIAAATIAAAALVALSFLLVHPAPSYDPWAWLLWGREVAGGALDTREGPAFKPLPVGIGALLSPFGSAAPWLWVGLVRVGALVTLWLAFRLGRRLSGGFWLGGVLAAVAVALCGHFADTAAAGAETALLLALALGAAELWRSGRPGWALALGLGCALLRVEAWPFLAVAAVVWWRRRGGAPGDGALVAASAIGVGALWLVPELIGSGDLLRSGARARVPNPGQPALADVPVLAAFWEAVKLPLWPVWAVVAVLLFESRDDRAARTALVPAAAGVAWIGLVAVMAQVGFSGEPRYSLPGAALVSISGAVGLVGVRRARRPTALVAVATVLLATACVTRIDDLRALRDAQAHQWALATDLVDAIDAAGGRDAVLACGQPYVGRYRGPLMAYRLDVAKRAVEPDAPPRPPGVVFQSARVAGEAATPVAGPELRPVARAGEWTVLRAC